MTKESYIAHQKLKHFSTDVLEAAGLNSEDADFFSDVLVQSNLEGVDSHGVSKLPTYYKRIKEGRIKVNPKVSIKKSGESILLVDGDNGPGPIVIKRAVERMCEVVERTGVCITTFKKSNHFGPASYYSQLFIKKKYISIITSNSPPGLAPWGGIEPYFGTNPIAFGFPTGTDEPILIDMSTSVVARGKIRLAATNDEEIPGGWAITSNGIPTTDPKEALAGSLLPIGGPKGYTLALAIEILSGLLSGASFGKDVQNFNEDSHGEADVGHFVILMDISRFLDLRYFEKLIQTMIAEIKAVECAVGIDEILIPGERRRNESKKRKAEGVYITSRVLLKLNQLADSIGIPTLK